MSPCEPQNRFQDASDIRTHPAMNYPTNCFLVLLKIRLEYFLKLLGKLLKAPVTLKIKIHSTYLKVPILLLCLKKSDTLNISVSFNVCRKSKSWNLEIEVLKSSRFFRNFQFMSMCNYIDMLSFKLIFFF